jgi:hypothetical protein
MSMMIMPAAPKLGFLGFGESKEGAIAAYDAAANKLQLELKKSLEEFPKAAAALNMWPKVMAEEKQFYTASQNAALRVALTDLRAAALELMERSVEADWYSADLKVAIIKADIALDEPPYSV